MKKKSLAYALSAFLVLVIGLIVGGILLANKDSNKELREIAFFNGENRIAANAIYRYNQGKEIEILGSSLSVKAIYSNNTSSTLSSSDFSYKVLFSADNNFDSTTEATLPTSTSNAGYYKITAVYKNCSVSIYVNVIGEPAHESPVEYVATATKTNSKPIYYGDSESAINFALTSSDGSTTENSVTYYIVAESTFNNIPENVTNKAKYILDTTGVNYTSASNVGTLNAGDYYVFAVIGGETTTYTNITNASKFSILPAYVPVAEPSFANTDYDGNSHELTINNYYTLVSGSLTGEDAGEYTTVIKPTNTQNYTIDWNVEHFTANDYTYYCGFDTFASDAAKGGIKSVVANKTDGTITITWQINAVERDEHVCLGEYLDLRGVNGETINQSVAPYSSNENNVSYRVALYSETNKNQILNSYANNKFKIELVDNNVGATLVIKDHETGNVVESDDNEDLYVDVTNNVYIVVPVESYNADSTDGLTLNYKITAPQTGNYLKTDFNGLLTLNKISSSFTPYTTLAVESGTTLKEIHDELFGGFEGLDIIWYVGEGLNPAQDVVLDLATEVITENTKYTISIDFNENVAAEMEDHSLYPILERIFVIGSDSATYTFEICSYNASLLENSQEYSYQKNGETYSLTKYGTSFRYSDSTGKKCSYVYDETLAYYKVYAVDENNNVATKPQGTYTQNQMSALINSFLSNQ